MKLLHDTWYMFLRHVRATLRMPVFVLISIVQPILWVLLFGQLFRAVTKIPGFESDSYVQFLTPGIAIMTAILGSAYSGMGLLTDMERGVLDRFLATPVKRGALIGGRLLHAAVQVVLQAVIILVVAALVGAELRGGLGGLLMVLLVAGLLGAAFGAFSSGLALLARRQELIIAVMNFIVLPMTFLSSMIMSRNLMPGWIRKATLFNPLDWAVTAARQAFEAGARHALGWRLAFLMALAGLCAGGATRAFRRYRQTM